jgi:hypothetical protein
MDCSWSPGMGVFIHTPDTCQGHKSIAIASSSGAAHVANTPLWTAPSGALRLPATCFCTNHTRSRGPGQPMNVAREDRSASGLPPAIGAGPSQRSARVQPSRRPRRPQPVGIREIICTRFSSVSTRLSRRSIEAQRPSGPLPFADSSARANASHVPVSTLAASTQARPRTQLPRRNRPGRPALAPVACA